MSNICFIFYQKRCFTSYENFFLFHLQCSFSLRYPNICNFHFHSFSSVSVTWEDDHRCITSLWCHHVCVLGFNNKLILWETKIAGYWKLVNWLCFKYENVLCWKLALETSPKCLIWKNSLKQSLMQKMFGK